MSERTRLGELELCVMERLWESAPSNAKAMHLAIGKVRGISHNTVQSTLERLFRKKLLDREKVSHAYVYSPAVSRDGLISRMVSEVVETLSNSNEGLVSAFLDVAGRADEKTLDELKRVIARYRENIVDD